MKSGSTFLVLTAMFSICTAQSDPDDSYAVVAGPSNQRLPVLLARTETGQIAAKAAESFEEKIQPILDENCVVCHMTGAENGGMNLEQGKSLASLVNVPSSESALSRIFPGEPGKSYLIYKLKGTQLTVGGQGERMPLGNPPLSPDLIASIEVWVRSLAAN